MVRFEPITVQHADGMLLPPVQKLVATIIFAIGKNANRIHHPPRRTKFSKRGYGLPHRFAPRNDRKVNLSASFAEFSA